MNEFVGIDGRKPQLESRLQRNGNGELGTTKWGVRVNSADELLRETKWGSQIQETVTPHLMHFARAGVAAIVGSLPRNLPGEYLRGLFETDLYEDPDIRYDENTTFRAEGLQTLYNRGATLLLLARAASDLITTPGSLVDIEIGKTAHTFTHRLLVADGNSLTKRGHFGEVFPQVSYSPNIVEMIYDQQKNGSGLSVPTALIFSAHSLVGEQESLKSVFTFLTYNDRAINGRIEVQAEKGILNGLRYPIFSPDPDFEAAKVFTHVINRSLQRFKADL